MTKVKIENSNVKTNFSKLEIGDYFFRRGSPSEVLCRKIEPVLLPGDYAREPRDSVVIHDPDDFYQPLIRSMNASGIRRVNNITINID